MNLISIVHKLRSVSGSNAKLEILRQHSDNTLWKKFLLATYDQRVTYGVSAPNSFDFDEDNIDEVMFGRLTELAARQITGNAAKDLAQWLSTYFGEIPRLVLNRSIKAGVSTGLINKAYQDLIPIFKTMKGKDVPITEYPVLSSIKFDGVKVFVFVRPSGVFLTTSSGADFYLKSLIKEMSHATYGVYEGELIHKDGKQIYRSVISGNLVSLMAGTRTDINDYHFVPYDNVSLEDWGNKKSSTSYIDRFSLMLEGFKTTIQDSKIVRPIDNSILNTDKEVTKYFNNLIMYGYEGSMHRYAADFYEWTGDKRTDRLIKKKAIKECVLMCIGIVPHSNPLKGRIGSLRCKGIVHIKNKGDYEVEVNVGSGLSKVDIQFGDDRYVGNKIEILYNTITESNGKYSLFLPRYKRIKGRE